MRSSIVIAVIIATWPASQLCAAETDIALDKLPVAVVDSIKKSYPTAELTKAVQIEDNGAIEYQVTAKDQGRRVKFTVEPSGTIDKLKKEIELKELPEPVTAALEKKYPKSQLKSAVSVFTREAGKEKLKRYEVKIKGADEKTIEVRLNPDGKIKDMPDKDK